MRNTAIAVAPIATVLLGSASIAAAQGERVGGFDVSVMGGVHILNENDTGLADNFVNIPAVGTVTYHVTPNLAAEGEFTWLIPVEQSVDLEAGESLDMKTPDVLAYQANLRANWPIGATAWTPYVVGGAGAVTFLSSDDTDRLPRLDESETMFAINFGGGLTYGIHPQWALRADFREFVAFPSDDAGGLSSDGSADEIWMERTTAGVVYRF